MVEYIVRKQPCGRKDGAGIMGKIFNVSGVCRPDRHYMADLAPELAQIRKMADAGKIC